MLKGYSSHHKNLYTTHAYTSRKEIKSINKSQQKTKNRHTKHCLQYKISFPSQKKINASGGYFQNYLAQQKQKNADDKIKIQSYSSEKYLQKGKSLNKRDNRLAMQKSSVATYLHKVKIENQSSLAGLQIQDILLRKNKLQRQKS